MHMMDQNAWQQRWKDKDTPWDMGGPHPHLPALIAMATESGRLKRAASIWVPGCGSGHDAASLAERGNRVLASDYSPGAIEEAGRLYEKVPNLTLAVADAFAEMSETFDAVFDRAMFNALPPDRRGDYIDACYRCLNPGGLFMTILFSTVVKEDPTRPPFEIKLPEMHVQMSDKFSLVAATEVPLVTASEGKIRGEILGVWRKAGAG